MVEQTRRAITAELSGQVAIVTGASRGLGKAIALEPAANGARVACVARDQAKLAETVGAVTESADQINNASGQISGASQAMSQAASEQAASVEQTTASIEEMSAGVSQNSENAKITETIATKAATDSDSCRKSAA